MMRVWKTGLEKRFCDSSVHHLLDFNDDVPHHIHNIVKKFLNNFENYLEKLFRDFYRDFDLSTDLLKRLEFLCYHIGVTFFKPPNYVSSHSMVVDFGRVHCLFVHA